MCVLEERVKEEGVLEGREGGGGCFGGKGRKEEGENQCLPVYSRRTIARLPPLSRTKLVFRDSVAYLLPQTICCKHLMQY